MPRRITAVPLESIETIEEKWVREHGETFKNYTDAGNQLGVTSRTVQELIKRGCIQTTPTKRVLVRSAAAWANSNRPTRKNRLLGMA